MSDMRAERRYGPFPFDPGGTRGFLLVVGKAGEPGGGRRG